MTFDPTKPMNEPLTTRIDAYLKEDAAHRIEGESVAHILLLREALQALIARESLIGPLPIGPAEPTSKRTVQYDPPNGGDPTGWIRHDPDPRLPQPFSPKEWHDISLCIGWTVAMSDGKDEPSLARREVSMRAMAAMRRVFGEGFHTRIMEAIERDWE